MKIKPGQLFRHYEGDIVRVITMGTHAIKQKTYVVYQFEGSGRAFIMPIKVFQATVTINGQKLKQFIPIKEGKHNA